MPISQQLQNKLRETLGTDAGEDLVSLLEAMDGLRGDVRELRHEMQLGFARQEAALEKALREQTRFFFLAWAVLLAAILDLYARGS